MGWRPSSWWARSSNRRPDPVAPTTPVTPTSPARADTAAPAAAGSSLASAWRDLPGLTPTNAVPLQRIAVRDDFVTGLASHGDPRFLEPLGHLVDPSMGGLVEGLAVPGAPHVHEGGPDLAIPQRPPAEPAPRVQRQLAWSGSDELATVRWELPGPVDPAPESAAPALGSAALMSPEPLLPGPLPPEPLPPEPLPTGPLSTTPDPGPSANAETTEPGPLPGPGPLPNAEAPTVRRPQPPAPVQRQRANPPVPTRSAHGPSTAGFPAAGGPRRPSADHDHPTASIDEASTGWTEMTLPPVPVQRSVSGELPGGAAAQSSAHRSTPGLDVLTHQTTEHTIGESPSGNRPPVLDTSVVVTPALPLRPTLVPRAPHRPTADSPNPDLPTTSLATTEFPTTEIPSAALPTTDPAATDPPAREAQITESGGIPLIQRSATSTAPMSTPDQRAISGRAMSFATMFGGPSAQEPDRLAEPLATVSHHRSAEPDPRSSTTSSHPIIASPVVLRSAIETASTSPAAHSPSLQTPRTSLTPVAPTPRAGDPPATRPVPTPLLASPPMAPVQRQDADEQPPPDASPAAALSSDSAPPPEPSAAAPSTAPAASAARGPSVSSSPSAPAADLDELARQLYEPLVARIRAELWLDRERAGVFGGG